MAPPDRLPPWGLGPRHPAFPQELELGLRCRCRGPDANSWPNLGIQEQSPVAPRGTDDVTLGLDQSGGLLPVLLVSRLRMLNPKG